MPIPMGPGTRWVGTASGKFRLIGKSGRKLQKRGAARKALGQAVYRAQTKADFAQVARVNRLKGAKRGAAVRAIGRRRAARAAGRRVA